MARQAVHSASRGGDGEGAVGLAPEAAAQTWEALAVAAVRVGHFEEARLAVTAARSLSAGNLGSAAAALDGALPGAIAWMDGFAQRCFYPTACGVESVGTQTSLAKGLQAFDGILQLDPRANSSLHVGFRLYLCREHAQGLSAPPPLVVLFHGNAEYAREYDDHAPRFAKIPSSLLVWDFRGFGWSSGTPQFSTLFHDAEAMGAAVRPILAAAGVPATPATPLVLFGRSMGGICASHLAAIWPERWRGVVFESAMAGVHKDGEERPEWAVAAAKNMGGQLFANAARMEAMGQPWPREGSLRRDGGRLPVLILHGRGDELVPFAEAETMAEMCKAHVAMTALVSCVLGIWPTRALRAAVW
eukprot:gnl/TRDRNA2_/TRDRNA2_175484_c0_seq4.p1 gnl/TRDRNA2_/TRDRNA2_175484_c0~~gnl/TRDRNA2_/TRDRNA2_175484_c0_seq4.p1  ORF type:complete len:359 (+),score=64.35 gnl/TRDRNA2_/TRDRNA2_175484_c0_seq4:144-1220(+)